MTKLHKLCCKCDGNTDTFLPERNQWPAMLKNIDKKAANVGISK
jgi:hypothetical protein